MPIDIPGRKFPKTALRSQTQDEKGLKPKDLLLVRKFVRRIKSIECKSINVKTFEKAANLGSYEKPRFAAHSKICPQNEGQ